MAFTSLDDVISEISNEKSYRADWQYRMPTAISTAAVSVGVDLASYPGQFGSNNAFPGTALTWVTCNDSGGNGTQVFGIPHGGNVSPDKKHLINTSTITPPAGLPGVGGVLVLVDLQGYWPGISHTTTSTQTLLGTPSLRYTNGDGCRLYMVTTATLGATAHNIRINYYDQGNNIANTGLIAARASSIAGQINSSTPNSTQSLYFPLVEGDTGVQNVANVVMSAASTSGTSALCLAKPLAFVPLTTSASYITEREFINQTPSMPEIKDGACLVWLYFSVAGGTGSSIAAATQFVGHIETAWG